MPPTTQSVQLMNHNNSHPQYKTQTLAPLRLSQDHFVQQSKTNTLGHKQAGQPQVHYNNNKNHYNTCVNHGGGGGGGQLRGQNHINNNRSPPDSPPELPIRNGLITSNYNHNNLQQNGGRTGSKVISTAKHYH